MQMYACVCNLHKKSVDIYINSINKLLADFTDMCVCINWRVMILAFSDYPLICTISILKNCLFALVLRCDRRLIGCD